MLAVIVVASCDSQQASLVDRVVFDGSHISLPLPGRLRNITDIDPTAVRAIATINGVETELNRNASGQFSAQITVPALSEFTVQIDFTELYLGQQLPLARASKTVATGAGDLSFNLVSEDYDYGSFDSDGDSASNIIERKYDTDPLDSTQSPELIVVEVFAELPSELVAANFSNYRLVARVGGEARAVDASTGQFRESITVVRQANLTVTMRLVEGVTGRGLTIGEQSQQVTDSQAGLQNGALAIFNAADWNLDFDQDNDGTSDAEELIAGTDLLSGPAPGPDQIAYTVVFDVPAEITNTQTVFATLTIDGQSIDLIRTDDSYTGSATAQAGAAVVLDARVRDTYQGSAVVLATFDGEATPVANGTLDLQGFSIDIDTDDDGTPNYLELAQGTDPFSAPLDCTPVIDTIFATLTDDAYLQDSVITNNGRLQVDTDQRPSLIRFQFDDSQTEVIEASLNLTVGNDAGDGLLTVSAVSGFDWNDQSSAFLTVPASVPAGSAENEWERGVSYRFSLDPDVISGDVTLIIQQEEDGNDVAFRSSATVAPPELELVVERCN